MTFTFNMFYPKSMLVRSAWTGPPAPARKLALAGTPAQPRYAPLQVLFESGLIVRSYSGGRPLRGLTFPPKNVKDIMQNVKVVLKM